MITKTRQGYIFQGVDIFRHRNRWAILKKNITPNYSPNGDPFYSYRTLTDAKWAVTNERKSN